MIRIPSSSLPAVMDDENKVCSFSYGDVIGLDGSIRVPDAELEAERWRGRQQELAASVAQATLHDAVRIPSRRRPRAGHYPAGFSPYRMVERRGVVPLERRHIRNDMKVLAMLCQTGLQGPAC